MKRVYNYNTGKLYESDGTYRIYVEEISLDPDVEVDPNTKGEIDETYFSFDEADRCIDIMIDELLKNEGLSEDDVEIEVTDNGKCVISDGYKKWCFTISKDIDECGDACDQKSISNESVSKRFSKLRSMFEAAGLDEDDDEEDDKPKDNDKENGGDDEKEEGNDEDNDSGENGDEDEEEEKDLKAIIITVKKGDEDKCKEGMIDAGVSEDDIDILEGDEDDDTVDIRIDVNSVYELKDYLKKHDIDLEDEIGGEICDDDSDEEGEENPEGEEGDEKGEGDDEEFDFNDLGDIFGADDEE